MATDNLAYDTAKSNIDRFQDAVMQDHRVAIACRDFEDLLSLGIDSFKWLIRTDQTYREKLYSDRSSHDPELEKSLESLCITLSHSLPMVEAMIDGYLAKGFSIGNLKEFRECAEDIRAMANFLEDTGHVLPEAMADLADQAIEEHRRGQTSEFF